MNKNRDNDFKSLRDKLGDYRVDPPGEIWGNIASGIGRKGRRRNMVILLATAASIALAVSLGVTFRGFNRPVSDDLAESSSETIENRSPVEHELVIAEGVQDSKINNKEIYSADNSNESVLLNEETAIISKLEETVVQSKLEEQVGQSKLEQKVDQAISEILTDELADIRDPVDPKEGDSDIDAEIASSESRLEAYLDSIAGETDPINEDLINIPSDTRDLRWIIGGMMSPLYSFRDADGTVSNSAGTNEVESGRIAYAGGVQVGFRPGSRLTIESGILYNKMGINIGDVSGTQERGWALDFTPVTSEIMGANVIPISNSIGNIVSNRGDIFLNSYKDEGLYELNLIDNGSGFDNVITLDGVQQNLEYLEIPLNLKYSVIKRTIELLLVGGISTNFLVNNSVTAQIGDEREEIGYVSNLNSVNYSGNAGIGMIYHFHSNFSLSLEPRFRYYLNSVNDNTLPATRPYTIGVYTGINYRF